MTSTSKPLNNPRTFIRTSEPPKPKLTKAEQKKADAAARRAWKTGNVVGGQA